MKHKFFYKFQQLKRYVKQLNKLTKTGRFKTLTLKKRKQIISRIERLQMQLALASGKKPVKRLLLAATFALGAALTPVAAQTVQYKAKKVNPFELAPTGTYWEMPTLGDLDGDGDLDMISADYYGGFTYHENDSSATFPRFKAGVSNPFGLPATGSGYFRNPTLVDIDGDGDLDIVSAEYGGIFYYKNSGTNLAPSFNTPVANAFGFPFSYNTSIKFADMDKDGDFDALLLSSPSYGGLTYYENTGGKTNPVFGNMQSNPFGIQLGGYELFLEVGDVDGDGDIDFIIGEYYYGNINYYENTGTLTTPIFGSGLQNSIGLDMTGTDTYFVVPALGDIDKDGDLDLFAGEYSAASYYGGIINYQECNSAPMSQDTTISTIKNVDYQFIGSEFEFSDPDDLTAVSIKIATLPTKGTLNFSGSPVMAGDMILLSDITNLAFMPEADSIGMPHASFQFQIMDSLITSVDTNTVTINVEAPVGVAKLVDDATLTLAPNPATSYLRIEITGIEPQEPASLSVLDMSGRLVYREMVEPSELYNKTISTNSFANGVYFIVIETEQGVMRERFIKE